MKRVPGIVVCSRVGSTRIPRKPLVPISGSTAIGILLNRLSRGDIPICLAIPDTNKDRVLECFSNEKIKLFYGHSDNVLARFLFAAEENCFDPIVRVTHDDILQDPALIKMMVDQHVESKAEYTYISGGIRGMDAEVISLGLVRRAWQLNREREVEDLSFAFRNPSILPKILEFKLPEEYQYDCRMSLDYPDDVYALRLLFRLVDIQASGKEIVKTLSRYPEIHKFTDLPLVTVYTCAYNADKTISRAIRSVLVQSFKNFEYIVIDDCSTDSTPERIMEAMEAGGGRMIVRRNHVNVGLATSSNRALDMARGKFILRLDADDELLPDALLNLVHEISGDPMAAAVYSAYRDHEGISRKNMEHHIGGTLFRTSALREIRFCDGIRYLEGVELFDRLKSVFHVEHFEDPTWIYHKTINSMSRSDHPRRAETRELLGFDK